MPTILHRLQTLFYIVYYYFHLGWLYYNRWIFDPRPNLKDPHSHTIVILGDDNALGFGDWTMIGNPAGLAYKLPELIHKEPNIRQRWYVLNRGAWRKTSEEWLPESESLLFVYLLALDAAPLNKQNIFSLQKQTPKPTLLRTTLAPLKVRSADIFILIVGAEDVRTKIITPQQTLYNIRAICDHILKHSTAARPPTVYVTSVPTAGDDLLLDEVQRKKNEERNRLIKEWLKNPPANVCAGPIIDLSNFEYDRNDIYSKDRRHFNSHVCISGYYRVAKDFLLVMKSDMVKREFGVFKTQLGLDYASDDEDKVAEAGATGETAEVKA
ncbi:hypothetical protein BC937DRAFT_90600 [Endogone sp. FLAS-F59071]|nr:hypothetical protein BC937DRAFT_90600 [Endogone sp. FLAS-F59071]|eukprot:RUS16965.1 hypothetical protein BC937DRAFT_90600 [Endogone sp. FLAS-F59071]